MQHPILAGNVPLTHLTSAARLAKPLRAGRHPLHRAHVLVLEADRPTGILLRDGLEQGHDCQVEIAANLDEALDLLGNAGKPIALAMLDTFCDVGACVAILRLLIAHRARVAVTLHGHLPPEKYALPENLVGAAAYTHLATSGEAVAKAEAVMAQGLTVREIVDRRIVPATLDYTSAIAIYGVEPGDRFPITLRV